MKNSIAHKVTRLVSLILIIALALMLAGSFFIVSNIVYDKNVNYMESVLTMYYDLMLYGSDDPFPIDIEHTDRIAYYGDYICRWYLIDFAYVYVFEKGSGVRTMISFSANNEDYAEGMIGYTFEREPKEEELAVWNEDEIFGTFRTVNYGQKELSTIVLVKDQFGNTAVAGVDYSYDAMFAQIIRLFLIAALFLALITVGLYFFVFLIIRRHVSRPAEELSRAMQEYLSEGKHSDIRLEEKGTDEYRMIAGAFNSMSDNIRDYITSINALTRDQAQQQTELDIAAKIQKGFLPAEKFGDAEYDISAVMTPAKNVGGDLYDYVRLDGGRVLVVIADVSGKGVSASIFMSVTLTLIRQYAKMDLPPHEILRRTNDSLSENNPENLFATAFVGIYDSRTRTFTYSNAGHNIPYVTGSGCRPLDKAVGLLLGMFGGEEYTSASVGIGRGESLFLYTDGVNESVNRDNEFYGTERLEKVLSEYRKTDGGDVIGCVLESLREFSDGAEQHDDITMLSLTQKESAELFLDPDVKELEKIKEAILSLPYGRDLLLDLCLAAEECFVNIVSYGFPDGARDEKIHFTLSTSDRIELIFEDGGIPFNPLTAEADPDGYDIDTQIGGLGTLLAFSVTNLKEYEYKDGKNILKLTKLFEEETK